MARENGLQKSLFALLAEAHPEAIVTLQYQYRMNKDIMTISNTLIYDNKLKCASKSVAQRQLDLPHFQQALDSIHGGASCTKQSCWIEQILDPSRKVVFLDTDKMSATEERIMETVVNKAEASIVLQLAEALLLAGVPEERLAVISVYRSQLRLISQSLRGRPGVEIATIDKYQGRDKECVLVSLVRSNETGKTGELLRDWRRINVAFTRAKSKIIIIGSSTTLSTTALFGIFLELMRTNNWIYQLHLGAENEHTIQPPPSPREKRNREHKTHSPAEAILKNRPILRDVYNSSSL
ncbi:AAA domain-containing protein [Zychaea mexicana]|uniref:AAA domain-containing protein n=1 Tax=Zychaea mexicana TaxID=64656 RepID=UPI0022FEA592|nr:AAA domain-containing protein [Zychaea mexicana]KAI9482549.1 AAA domain-containing protein [Zychaea mexicana]